MHLISICGVTYNRKDLVEGWINSILANIPAGGKFYIADNNSKDGTKEFLKSMEKYPAITKIEYYDKNIGKGPALNRLFKLAVKQNPKPEYLVSTDSDIVVGQGWYNQLLNVFQIYKDSKKVGWVSPIYYDDNNPIPHSRDKMYVMGKERGTFIDNIGCAGGFFMMPTSMYEEVGGYVSENKYGGVDGTYLHTCRKAGYRCGYTTECVVRHLRGGANYDEYEVWKRKIQKNLKKRGVFTFRVEKGFWDD